MTGYIHSCESFGTVDGPGIRFVVFFQGCPLRCQFCHNPDTWDFPAGKLISAEELISRYKRNHTFYKNGGITATGGEPLMQLDFLTEFFKLAKEEGIHTTLDTSGATYTPDASERFDRLMQYTDLVMLDIKHIDDESHIRLTGKSNKNILLFAKYLEQKNVPLWIRHVVIEGITDSPDDLFDLGKFIGTLKNLKALDILPFHTLGKEKYEKLGISYPLKEKAPLSIAAAADAKEEILRGIKSIRQK